MAVQQSTGQLDDPDNDLGRIQRFLMVRLRPPLIHLEE
jgi:hypothetical protein